MKQPWVTVAVALACAHLGANGLDDKGRPLREDHRPLTVAQFAKYLGYSKQAVYNWMHEDTMKKVESQTVRKVSEWSHVPMEWLMR